MAITYTWGTPLVRPRKESERVTDCARGLVPLEEIDEIINRNKPKGHIVIEVRKGAYTPEEWAELADTTESAPTGRTRLPKNDYGIKWRAWYGDPLPEQMAGEPWETIPGGES